MQTRYPDALWLPLTPESTTQEQIVPVQVILHTIVGSAAGAIRGMQGADTPGESHLVNPFGRDAAVRMTQLMPFDRRADCNWQVNRWRTPTALTLADGIIVPAGSYVGAISIESEDDGTPEDTPWDPGQLDRFARFLAWARRELHIPLERCPHPFQPGVGYHSMPGLNRLASWDPHLTAGPFGSFVDSRGRKVNVWNPWTNTVGKSCPGPARIAQFDGLLATARALAAPPPVETFPPPTTPPADNPEDDDDMAIIITNAEQHPVYGEPGTGRFLLLDSGQLRHIAYPAELAARCKGVIPSGKDMLKRGDGSAWTNEQLAQAGIS